MSVSREQLIKECVKEPPIDTKCHRCGGTGKIHVSVGGGCMGYDDEVKDCLECMDVPSECHLPPSYETYSGAPLLNCPRCGGSLCAEEYHDCEREREWQERYGL
jgi:hypothetical protein